MSATALLFQGSSLQRQEYLISPAISTESEITVASLGTEEELTNQVNTSRVLKFKR